MVKTAEKSFAGHSWLVMVANTEWAGGDGMRIAPGAVPDDALLNITIIPRLSKVKAISKILSKISSGQHLNEPSVSYFTSTKILVESTPPAVLDVDGELVRTTPVTFTVCAKALQVASKPIETN